VSGQIHISELESELTARFNTRQEQFEHGACRFSILLPRAADELLDEEAFEKDERMPYWADLWPSAKGLARWLIDQAELSGVALELGCGVALPSIVMRSRGIGVLATDYNNDGLMFARCNAQRNRVDGLRTQLLDWRSVPIDFGAFDFVCAADVLYEQRNAEALTNLLPRVVSPTGRFLLADPNRRYLSYFQELMEKTGWDETPVAEIDEQQLLSNGPAVSTIRILEFTRPTVS
jgi:predicted nicotinamide N-methyase